MKPLRPQLRGLIFKLTVFYVLLSLPCLVLVESAILIFEFHDFMAGVERGSLTRATETAARDLADAWPSARADEPKALATWAEAWVLRLQRPHGGLIDGESYILMELANDPLGAAVLDTSGHVLATALATADWQPELPRADAPELAAASAAQGAQALAGRENPYRVRRILTAVRAHNGNLLGFLFVELRLPVPWHKFLLDVSLEWPIVLGYLFVFGIASSFFLATWVTRRLNRVARAATAWSRGEFSELINDASRDELGHLSALLDRMALELKALMGSRAQLAILAERQRLARDLHDTVKQKAFALNLQLATVRRQLSVHPAAERIVHAERLSQQIQQELVHILDELRTSDADLPFMERLRMRVQEWAQVSGTPLSVELDEIPAISTAIETTLLRIVDEGLANVLRHSAATQVNLVLRRDNNRLSLIIADNGHGVSNDAPAGMGLINMRERAESLPGGEFAFATASDSGTCINITWSV